MSPPAARRRRRHSQRAHSLRIIGGAWRGRRVPVVDADAEGLRPTPDRVRETLFNWLAPRIEGSRCLDLFAGTGALGLEALSRGAARVCFVDRNPRCANAIREAAATLGADARAEVVQGDALAMLDALSPGRYDIVFVDPPFAAGLHADLLERLRPRLADSAQVYVEYPAAERSAIDATLAHGYAIRRAKRAGAVGYCLAQPAPAGEDSAP